MTGERMSGNSLRPLTCRPKRLRPSHENGEALKEVGEKTVSLEMKKERFRTYEAAEAMAAAIP
jgi:hypothetical protein